MEGSSKRGGGSKRKQTRPKVRANLGEPTRFRLQDEPDPVPQTPYFPNQPYQYQPNFSNPYPNPNPQFPSYQNQPFIPPFPTNPLSTIPTTQQSQNFPNPSLDPLEDNNIIHQFATEYREPQQGYDDDDSDPLEEDEEDEEEEEAEEQEEEDAVVATSGKKKGWTSDEEVALVKAYLHVSESRKHSNQQKRDQFWKRIVAHFSKFPGATNRNMDQMTSKWGDLNRKMSKFNACFVQLSRNPQSGASEATILQNALKDYCTIFKKRSFPHMASWEIARRHPKWEPIQLVDFGGPTAPKKKAGASKRSKTSESGHYTTSTDGLSSNMPEMNLNDEPEEDDTPTGPTPTRKKSGESVKDKLAVVADSVMEYKSARLLEMNESKLRKEKALESKVLKKLGYETRVAGESLCR